MQRRVIYEIGIAKVVFYFGWTWNLFGRITGRPQNQWEAQKARTATAILDSGSLSVYVALWCSVF